MTDLPGPPLIPSGRVRDEVFKMTIYVVKCCALNDLCGCMSWKTGLIFKIKLNSHQFKMISSVYFGEETLPKSKPRKLSHNVAKETKLNKIKKCYNNLKLLTSPTNFVWRP